MGRQMASPVRACKMTITRHRIPWPIAPVQFSGLAVEEVGVLKLLGVTFDKHLFYGPHLQRIALRAAQRIGFLRKTTKTVSMVIRSQNMPPCTLSIRINDKPVEQRDTHRHLGVTFSSTLRWAEHIDCIIYNASRKLGVLRRLRRTLTPAVLLDIYTTCI